MKNMVLIAGLATTMALGGLSAVEASSHKGGKSHGGMQMKHSFEDLDADGDGKITPEEMAGHMQARFEGADSDGDGALSRDELVARMMERRAERMARYADHMIERHDETGDGQHAEEGNDVEAGVEVPSPGDEVIFSCVDRSRRGRGPGDRISHVCLSLQ